jgi:hypothetical protein
VPQNTKPPHGKQEREVGTCAIQNPALQPRLLKRGSDGTAPMRMIIVTAG